jgi:hypothetical protein
MDRPVEFDNWLTDGQHTMLCVEGNGPDIAGLDTVTTYDGGRCVSCDTSEHPTARAHTHSYKLAN